MNFRRSALCILTLAILCATPAIAQSDPSVYERGDRDARQKPEWVMDVIGLQAGMTIADVGAGGGYFTVKFAERVGASGKVFANDINQDYLRYIRDRLAKEGITNTEVILGGVDDPNLPDGSCDMVFMSDVYHHLDKPLEMLVTIKTDLRPDGRLVIVETDTEKGRSSHASDPDDVIEVALKAGYEVVTLNREHSSDFILILRAVR